MLATLGLRLRATTSLENIENESPTEHERVVHEYTWTLVDSLGTEQNRDGSPNDGSVALFETPKYSYTLIDIPDSRDDSVANMMAGVSLADVALLVIDASEDGFATSFAAGGKIREHAFQVLMAGIRKLIFALNVSCREEDPADFFRASLQGNQETTLFLS